MLLTLLKIQQSLGVTGTLSASESESDSLSASGKVFVKGALSATESAADQFSASGVVRVAGAMSATESASDTLSAIGKVIITGSLAATETNQDSFAAPGKVLIHGDASVTESGDDTIYASGGVVISGDLLVSEVGEDGITASGALDTQFTLTPYQALLLRKIHTLHGLSSSLLVSKNSRVSGDVVQTVIDQNGTVTIETIDGNDTVSGTVGQIVEELAALHGITETLEVTSTSRSAGLIMQMLNTSGGVTTVTRQ